MTGLGAIVATFLAGAAAGGALAADPGGAAAPQVALVIDASLARDGRELVDERLRAAGVELRAPRTAAEAKTDVRYLAAAKYRVVVAGPRSTDAARASGVDAVRAADRAGALAAVER